MKAVVEFAMIVICLSMCIPQRPLFAAQGEELQFRTGYLANPIELTDGTLDWSVTAIDLDIDDMDDDHRRATVTLHESKVEFDDFGDARVIDKGRVHSWDARLLRVPQTPERDSRKLFTIEFADDHWKDQFQFVWSPKSIHACRLLVNDREKVNILPVTNRVAVTRESETSAYDSNQVFLQSDLFVLKSDDPAPSRHGFFRLDGDLNDSIMFTHDLNRVELTPFGDPGMTTLASYSGERLTFTQQTVTDASGRGRRVYRSSTWLGIGLALVFDPASVETQRLIVRKDDDILHILNLYDPRERGHGRDLEQLDQSPDREPIIALHQSLGYKPRVIIRDQRVTDLQLSGNSVSKSVLADLSQLIQLVSLRLNGCNQLSGSDFSALAAHPSLAALTCNDTPFSDEGLKAISSLEKLQSLRIQYEQFGPRALNSPDYFSPSELCTLTKDGLARLCELRNLRSLILHRVPIGDADLDVLIKLPQLKSISLYYTHVTAAGFMNWWSKANVSNVSLTLPPPVGGQSAISINLNREEHSAVLNGEIRDDILALITSRSEIKYFRIEDWTHITDPVFQSVLAMDWLESLSLRNCMQVNDASLAEIAKMSHLRELDLWRCSGVTDASLPYLRSMSQLEWLNIGMTKISDAGRRSLQAELTQCKFEQ